MKVLVKKIENLPELNEVYLQPWHSWVDTETGAPLTAECYGYAMCEVPDGVEELTADDFEVWTETVTDGEGNESTVYRAKFVRDE